MRLLFLNANTGDEIGRANVPDKKARELVRMQWFSACIGLTSRQMDTWGTGNGMPLMATPSYDSGKEG